MTSKARSAAESTALTWEEIAQCGAEMLNERLQPGCILQARVSGVNFIGPPISLHASTDDGGDPKHATTKDLFLSLDEYSSRFIEQRIDELAAQILKNRGARGFGGVPFLLTRDMEVPKSVNGAATGAADGISLRVVNAFDIDSDRFVTRWDVFFGWL